MYLDTRLLDHEYSHTNVYPISEPAPLDSVDLVSVSVDVNMVVLLDLKGLFLPINRDLQGLRAFPRPVITPTMFRISSSWSIIGGWFKCVVAITTSQMFGN